MRKKRLRWIVWLVLAGWLMACTAREPDVVRPAFVPSTPWPSPTVAVAVQSSPQPASPTVAPTQTATPRPSATATRQPSVTPRPSPSATVAPSATPTALPPSPTRLPSATAAPPSATALPPSATVAPVVGLLCAEPPDDYRRVTVGRHTVSRRTLAMLDNAQALYGGRGSMRLLIQGSYDPSTDASFGTHDGGGAVDIWMVEPTNTAQVLPDTDIERMVRALRESGFAAWFRPANMLYQGMYPHIHAIAIGDEELSEAALAQVTGPHGYFAGQNGLPDAPFAGPDPHGGPIVCRWMTATGASAPPPSATPLPMAGCQPPVDDYARVSVDGHALNQRTFGMLQQAQALYGGPGNLLWVTQGSYTTGEGASFGTHDGGGAVDLSIRHPQTGEFLFNETERMVRALRLSGFAAWYRDEQDGFVPHIHAIAIGDAELSEAATAQLTGEQGYFRGRNGLPAPASAPDRHGGPTLCPWMEAIGYQDLR